MSKTQPTTEAMERFLYHLIIFDTNQPSPPKFCEINHYSHNSKVPSTSSIYITPSTLFPSCSTTSTTTSSSNNPVKVMSAGSQVWIAWDWFEFYLLECKGGFQTDEPFGSSYWHNLVLSIKLVEHYWFYSVESDIYSTFVLVGAEQSWCRNVGITRQSENCRWRRQKLSWRGKTTIRSREQRHQKLQCLERSLEKIRLPS